MAAAINGTVSTVGTLARADVLAPLRPDRYLRMAAAARDGGSVTLGFAITAQRCPDRPGLIDELGTLTWLQVDLRANALAAGLQTLGEPARTVGIMCRNHRGFVAALLAADRIGVDVLLLTSQPSSHIGWCSRHGISTSR